MHVPAGQHTSRQIPSTRECRYFGLYRVVGSLPSHGTDPATAISTFPLHTRPQPCILGAQCLGSPHGSRPRSFTMSVGAHILPRYPYLIYCGGIVVDAKRFGASFSVDASGVSSSSRGLVGDTSFAVFPNVRPMHTFIITIILQSVFLVKLWRTPTYRSFLTALTLCGYTSFMFGWHVHEKAILLVLVPLR